MVLDGITIFKVKLKMSPLLEEEIQSPNLDIRYTSWRGLQVALLSRCLWYHHHSLNPFLHKGGVDFSKINGNGGGLKIFARKGGGGGKGKSEGLGFV